MVFYNNETNSIPLNYELLAFSKNVYTHLNIMPQWNLDKLILLLYQLGHRLVNPISPNIKFEIPHSSSIKQQNFNTKFNSSYLILGLKGLNNIKISP